MIPVRLVQRHWDLFLASLLLLGAAVALVLLDDRNGTLRAGTTPRTIAWYLVAFAGFGLAAWWSERRTINPWVLWTVPIAARLLLLLTEPTLSDDVYRYLWDGHVATQGISPYLHPINAAALDPVEIPIRRLANNPGLASPYLPTAHGVFTAAAFTLPSTAVVMQTVMVGFDLATAGLLSGLLVRAGLPRRRVLLYLWNPLVIVEIAHGAHLDALMVMLTVAALAVGLHGARGGLADHGHRWRRVGSGVLLALATLTRPLPALAGPVLWPRWRWGGRVAFALTVAALLLPFGLGRAGWGLDAAATGTGVFGSARVYSRDFHFNGALNGVLTPGSTLATVVAGGAMAAVLLVVWRRAEAAGRATIARGADDGAARVRADLRLVVVPVMAYVVLTPVMHPWYLVLLMALLPFVTPASGEAADRWLLTLPWYYLAAAVSFSYLTYLDPDRFGERTWVLWLEWAPTLLGLAAVVFWVHFALQAEGGPASAPGSSTPSVGQRDLVAVVDPTGPDREQH